MDEAQWQAEVPKVADKSLPLPARAAAVDRITAAGDHAALAALTELAGDLALPDEIAYQVGAGVAVISMALGLHYNDAPLHDFSGTAYDGYDQTRAANGG